VKKTAFTEEQVIDALRRAEAGTALTEVCRKLGVRGQTCYRWDAHIRRHGGQGAGTAAAAGG